MDKQAYSEMYGRELATRAFVRHESNQLEKSANNGDVNEQRLANAQALLNDLKYREEQNKLAFNRGKLAVLTQLDDMLSGEKTASTGDLADMVDEARNELAKTASMAPETEGEDEEMFESMVKGAAEAAAFLHGEELTEDIVDSARDLVAAHYSNDQ